VYFDIFLFSIEQLHFLVFTWCGEFGDGLPTLGTRFSSN